MKRLQWTAFCALALILFSAMPVEAFEIGARALYWFPTLKADVRADQEGVSGTTIDVKDQLGMSNESFPSFEVFGGVGKHHLSLAYTPLKYDGSTTMTTPLTFNGVTYDTGVRVDSSLKLRMLDLEYQYKLLDLENVLAGFSLSAIGQIKYIDGEMRMEAPAAATSSDYNVRFPIPMIGVGAHIGLLAGILEARAKVAGSAYSSNYLFEAMAELAVSPIPFVDINAGYKYIKLKIDRHDVFLDSQFAGPYVGLTVSF
jgi:hypothetical protein